MGNRRESLRGAKTVVNRTDPPPSRSGILSTGKLFVILVPILVLGAFTALLAAFAALLGWYSPVMLPVATDVAIAVIALMAAFILYLLAQRQTSAEALHDIEARIGAIVDSAMDAIITIDTRHRIQLFNAAAEKVFQRSRDEVLGQPLEMLLPERYRGNHAHLVEGFGRTGATTRRMGDNTVVLGLRADGSEFPAEASISQLSEGNGKLYTVILRDVTERTHIEDALKRSRQELRELAAASNSVREQEKSRIARELHDELAQDLTAMKMDLTWLQEHLPKEMPSSSERLTKMQAMLDATVAATRRISADLRPLMLDDLGLIPAAEWLVQNFMERTGIACDFETSSPNLDLQDPYATAVFRILQESLTNVARHAEATLVHVRLGMENDQIQLTVSDDGRGFSTGDPRKPGSFGLMGLRERAYLLGGDVSIESSQGSGTAIAVTIPLDISAAAHS